jgi:hypothetical protein
MEREAAVLDAAGWSVSTEDGKVAGHDGVAHRYEVLGFEADGAADIRAMIEHQDDDGALARETTAVVRAVTPIPAAV